MLLLWSEAVDVEAEPETRFSLPLLRGPELGSRQVPNISRDSAEAARSRQTPYGFRPPLLAFLPSHTA
jgi:hypothetical protein